MSNDCEHKWVPNGMTKKEIWSTTRNSKSEEYSYKAGERVMASCICEKCGEIRIEYR